MLSPKCQGYLSKQQKRTLALLETSSQPTARSGRRCQTGAQAGLLRAYLFSQNPRIHKQPHQNSDLEKVFVQHVNKASDILVKGLGILFFFFVFFFPSKFIPGQSPKSPRQMEWFVAQPDSSVTNTFLFLECVRRPTLILVQVGHKQIPGRQQLALRSALLAHRLSAIVSSLFSLFFQLRRQVRQTGLLDPFDPQTK